MIRVVTLLDDEELSIPPPIGEGTKVRSPVSSNFPVITASTSRDDVRVIMVEYNQETNQVTLKVYIRMGQGYKQIKFPFDLAVDTPEAVAREMVVELNLNEMVFHNIANGIFDSLQDANLVPKPIVNTPQVTPPTPLETTTDLLPVSDRLNKERSGSAGKFTISAGFYADFDKIVNPKTEGEDAASVSTEQLNGTQQQPQLITSQLTSSKPTEIPKETSKTQIAPLLEGEPLEVNMLAESPHDATSLLSPRVPSTLNTPQDLIVDRPEQNIVTLTTQSERILGAKEDMKNVLLSIEKNQSGVEQSDLKVKVLEELVQNAGKGESLESKGGKKPVQIPKQLTINIPQKTNGGGPVVVQQTAQLQPNSNGSTKVTADKDEITKAWLVLLRKQKREEQELREQHKKERDEFRRSYGIIANTNTVQAPPQQSGNVTQQAGPQINGTVQHIESPVVKAKSSPPGGSSSSKVRVLPSKQMKTVFEKLISDIETRIGEDFKTSKTNPNEVEKFTTTTQIVNELKRSQPLVYKITTTTMTTTSSVNSKAQEIMKQRQSVTVQYGNNKASPAVVDTLLQVDDDSPTSTVSTPTLGSVMSPNTKEVFTPSRLMRTDVNSKSTGNLRQLEEAPTTLPVQNNQPHQHSLSEPTQQSLAQKAELKRSNTTAVLPSHNSGDDLIVQFMTKNIDSLLMSKEGSKASPSRKSSIDDLQQQQQISPSSSQLYLIPEE